MNGLIGDQLIGACVLQVFNVLDDLKLRYAKAEQDEQESLRNALSIDYRRLEDIETNRWMEVKNRVQKLINTEINELDQRPVLRFKVLNIGTQNPVGNLFGEVHNIGRVAAEKIIIQATYTDGSSSNQYILEKLLPDAGAVFELDYSFGKDAEKVEYILSANFTYSDKSCTSTVARGTLEITEMGDADYPVGLLTKDVNGIMFSVSPDTGEVYSPDFVGRKDETAQLRNLVEGDDFANYQSALVYGIRRTGKTTLLNYFKAYIGAKRDNIICVGVDCQSDHTLNPIQDIFVNKVITEIERQMPTIKMEPEWEILKGTWGDNNFCAQNCNNKLHTFAPHHTCGVMS